MAYFGGSLNRQLAVLCGAVALSCSAVAQQPAEELTEVIVTGTRVATNGNDSPTPVTVINVEEMQAVRPGTIADQLNDMPQFSSSQGQQTGIGAGSANGGNPNGSGNVLNLRNFGVTRNLILFDGHRVAPNSANGTVSIDLIPQLLLKRVDVVTGGASAVYGSDAITGVVNFITDTEFTGLKTNAQFGQAQEGDGDTAALGVAWGADLFGGRGHFMASYEYRGDEGIDARSAREWGRTRWHMVQTATPAGTSAARYLVPFGTRQNAAFGGAVFTVPGQPANAAVLPAQNAVATYYFSGQGVLSPMVVGTALPAGARATDGSNGSGSYFDQSLKAELNSHQLFSRFDFDFTDSLHGWVKVAGTDTYNSGYAISSPTAQASNNSNIHSVFVNNPFLSAQARNLITNNGALAITTFGVNKVHSGPNMNQYRQLTEIDGSNLALDFGLNGSFGEGWKWELALIHGSNTMDVTVNNAINLRKLGAALDAVPNPTPGGSPVCYVSTQVAFASLYPGCVPYSSIFGPSITAQEAAYLFDTLYNTTETKMNNVEAFVTGAPFDSWAGPVSMAFSAQARKLSYSVFSNVEPATPTTPISCLGLRLVTCGGQSQSYFQGFSYSRAERSVDVTEAAVEFDLPLLAGKPGAQDLSLNGAFRYTDYSTSGSVNSWKLGVDWKITDALNFRGTRSRDIRAPTMHELYAPGAVGSYSGTDWWTGQSLTPAPAATLASGNERLTPELADTVTYGFVFRPESVPGLSVALDHYYIKVQDSLVTYDGANQTVMLTCGNSGGTSSLCDLIFRPINQTDRSAANNATRLLAAPVNIAQQWTRGADLEVNYTGRMFEKPFNVRLFTNYQPHNVNVDTLGGVTTENAGAITGNPIWRATLVASMSLTEKLRVSVLERWRGRLDWYPTRSNGVDVVTNSAGLASVAYTNLNLSYNFESFGGTTEAYFNVQNLLDRQPPIYASPAAPFPGLNGVYPGDDGVGRYLTLGFRHKL